jgi:hypothetical protein
MDDNTYECPQCGGTIYPEMTRCPSCGRNMYPEDEESLPAVSESEKSTRGTALGAILIGLIIASGIALVLHFIVSTFATPANLGAAGIVILFLAGPFGALAGGFVGGGVKRDHPILLGGTIGTLALPVLVLFATHWVEVTPSFLLSPFAWLAVLSSIMAGAAGGWLQFSLSQNADWKEKWQVRGWEDLLYQDLLRKVRFNGSAANRLIDYERKHNPEASRLTLIQSAIERWERDNR